jgi:hypothetical protein
MENKLTAEKHAELLLLDEFAKAAMPAVIALATQTKPKNGTPHICSAQEFIYGDKPWQAAGVYAHLAYGVAVSMLNCRKQLVASEEGSNASDPAKGCTIGLN